MTVPFGREPETAVQLPVPARVPSVSRGVSTPFIPNAGPCAPMTGMRRNVHGAVRETAAGASSCVIAKPLLIPYRPPAVLEHSANELAPAPMIDMSLYVREPSC